MTDDLSVFWRNDARARALFYDLLARAEQEAFDDDFLAVLAAYREEAPDNEKADIFAAQYLLACGDAENAIVCGERAFQKRPLNCEVWKVLADAYGKLGQDIKRLTMQGYLCKFLNTLDIKLALPKEMVQEALARFSIALNSTANAPHLTDRGYIKNSNMHTRTDIFLGEEIPLTMPEGSCRFWPALYVEDGFLSTMATVFETMRYDPNYLINNRDVTFDIQKAREVTGTTTINVPEGHSVVVPIAGTKFVQHFGIRTSGENQIGYLGKWAFSYFKFNKTAILRSEEGVPYAVGAPIRLGHSPHRKKLVLNILVDGLCWFSARQFFVDQMPNTAKFFSRGVIFTQHFSAAEHTLSALPTIETGLYSHHTQIFNERDTHELSLQMRTLAECMQGLGYYASAPLATGQTLYSGVYRGYDRLISNYGFLPAYEGIERALRMLEALSAADHFMLLHTTDVHPLNIQTPLKFSTETEINVPLTDRFVPLDPTVPSVRTPRLPIYLEQFQVGLRNLDRALGQLLSYIEEHYDENEYIVNLYSDHGCALFDPDPAGAETDLIGEYATGATWMIRGAGVPEGIITDELTSSVDIYPTLGKLCGFPVADGLDGNLPAVFGGRERDAAYSVSQFPGQTFKLAVRTRDHVLRVETRGCTAQDGTADFADAEAQIYLRGHELNPTHIVDSAELRTFFYPRARDFVQEISNNGELFVR
ncbi:sulfatase-like hydrolase/transferase [uncultured Selenomonas sp.]|uniref:sulfatase-like hydrolase/transferase n=1 Tax=uncultured Selenomonas sp. TaxID=159275 RepID=UPI0028DCCCA5|nr:sulfatase-like hydrolase/transferase [uncultured Selenomonas sp.]